MNLKKDIQLEFISYTETPDDPYMLGVVNVKILGMVELRYKQVKKKDGTGTFFASASYSVTENSQKTYVAAFKLDTQINNFIVEEIRKNLESRIRPQASYSQSSMPEDNLPF